MAAKVDAKLKKILDTHLPVDEASSRSVQRVAALYIGHTDGKIDPTALRELCGAIGLFDYEGGGKKKENNFGANFTQNMKKDAALFDGDHSAGWKLTAAGKAEAKSIFDDGNPPTKRRVEGGSKKPKAAKPPKAPKAPKKAATKSAGKKAAKPAATKKPAKKAEGSDEERRKAAKRRLAKKRDLSSAPTTPDAAPQDAPAAASPDGALP